MMNRKERRLAVKLMAKNLSSQSPKMLMLTCCGKEAPCPSFVILPFVLLMEDELLRTALLRYNWALASEGKDSFVPLCPECKIR